MGFVLLSLAAGMLAASGQSDKSTESAVKELIFWDMVWGPADTYAEASRQVADEFNSSQDGIQVTVQSTPWNSWYEKFLTAVTSGTAPDVATCSSSAPYLFGNMGELLDLSDIVREWKDDGDINQVYFDTYNYGGNQFAIPWNVDTRCFYYRTDVFSDLGIDPAGIKTWDDFLDALRKVRDNTELIPFSVAGADNMAKHFGYQMMLSNAIGMVDRDLNADLDARANIEIGEFYNELVKEGLILDGTIGYKETDSQRLYYQGDAAVLFHTVGTEILQYSEIADKSAILPVFHGPSSDTPRNASFINPIVVFSQSDTPDAAISFVKWWSKNNTKLWTEGRASSMPVRNSILADPYFSSNWVMKETKDLLLPYNASAGFYPLKSEYPGFAALNGEKYAALYFQSVIAENGKADVKGIASDLNEKIGSLLLESK